MSSNGIQYGNLHTAPLALSIHKLLPLAALYFFLNSAGLPVGLFYTSIFSPLLFLWLYIEGKRWLTLKFLMCLLPFIVAHILLGIESRFYYARSSLLLWTVYVTVYAFCWALLKCKNLDRLFEQLIVLNFCAAMAALVLLPTPFSERLWRDDPNAVDAIEGAGRVLRLQLLTLEPSAYACLMAPLLIFAVLRLFHNPGKRNFIYAAMITIPLLLSQSFGGLSICAAGLGVALLATFRRLHRQRNLLLTLGPAVILIAGLLIVPNPISLRIVHVVMGTDSSTHSRTDTAFILAYTVAEPKSLWWGVGLGQVKLNDVSSLGLRDAIIQNSIADTFASLGIIAVLVKFVLELYLFFRTRVYTNAFRLAMFVTAFLYQFTGSSLMNVQEYLLWCLAFAPFFPTLNLQNGVPSKVSLSGSLQESKTGPQSLLPSE
jgi:hypothetical protein